jgi:hypothetical protein
VYSGCDVQQPSWTILGYICQSCSDRPIVEPEHCRERTSEAKALRCVAQSFREEPSHSLENEEF